MTTPLNDAMAQLDPANDDHWTNNGAPRMDALQVLVGDDSLTRKMVTDADPTFSREAAYNKNVPRQSDDAGCPVNVGPEEATAQEVVEDGTAYVMEMPINKVFGSEAHLTAFQAEVSALIVGWGREKQALEDKIQRYSRLSARATVHLQRFERGKSTGGDTNIGLYLAQQRKVREERAARAKAFIDKGVDAALVISQLTGKSVLDQAMSQRKAKLGSTRPDARKPANLSQ